MLRGLQREPCSLARRILAAFGVSEDTLLSIVAGGFAVVGTVPGAHQRAGCMILDAARAAADGAGRAHIATDNLLLGAFRFSRVAVAALAASGCTRR